MGQEKVLKSSSRVAGLARRQTIAVASAAVIAITGCTVATNAFAQDAVQEQPADDVQALIDEVSEVAQRVSAKNEEVKVAEDRLAEAEAELGDFNAKAEAAQREADDAAVAVAGQQQRVNEIAQSRYRGDNTNPVLAALAAEDPATAVERLGYLGALSRNAQENLSTMADNAAAARDKHDRAGEAVTTAEDKARALNEQREQLVAEKEALEQQQAEIEARVDALNPEQRAAWEGQFGGIEDIDFSKLGEGSSAVAEAALTRIGAPYGWGATGPDAFDCSGLMVWAYQQLGKSIPRTSQAQISGGTSVPIDQLQPGDIVGYYPGVTHVGMYIGNGQIVHASTYGVPVQVVPVDSMPIQGASRY